MIETCYLGLPKEKLMDFCSFWLMDFMACDYNLMKLLENKNKNIGRYFGINKMQ